MLELRNSCTDRYLFKIFESVEKDEESKVRHYCDAVADSGAGRFVGTETETRSSRREGWREARDSLCELTSENAELLR